MLGSLRQAAWRAQGRAAVVDALMPQLAAPAGLARHIGLVDAGEAECSPSTSGRCSSSSGGGGCGGVLLAGGSGGTLLAAGAGQWQQQRQFLNFMGLDGDVSKTYNERKLIGYSPRQMFEVVAGVDHYHLFVPWCVRSTVTVRRPPTYMEAELEVGFQMFTERYTSRITLQSPVRVESRVDDSTLFHHLYNRWEFRPGPTPATTWLTFDVDFAFKSPLYRQIASVFFEEVVQRMMGAFEGRCRQLYGPSSLHAKRAVQQ